MEEELRTRRQFVCKAYGTLRNSEEEIDTVVCEVTHGWKDVKDIKIIFQDQSASDFPPLVLVEVKEPILMKFKDHELEIMREQPKRFIL